MSALSHLDVLDVCQVMLERAGLPVQALVQHMGGAPVVAAVPAVAVSGPAPDRVARPAPDIAPPLEPAVPKRRGPGSGGKPGAQLVAPARGTVSGPAAAAPRPAVEVITPASVVPQVIKTPPPRFAPQAGERLSGGFSACRPGINPMTGDPW